MKIAVLKFGGTSVNTKEKLIKVYHNIKKYLDKSYKVVVVVSAMGRVNEPYSTDTLKSLVKNYITEKELDRLISVGEIISSIIVTDFLLEKAIKAHALSYFETGIITNAIYNNASIIEFNEYFYDNYFEEYDCIVVPGFIGINEKFHVTTLGRGGSDTTATILGLHLSAEVVEIISDVKGIYDKDPKIHNDAKLIKKLNYDELLNMTLNNAKFMHHKAAIIASSGNLNLIFKHLDDFDEYTFVHDDFECGMIYEEEKNE